MEGYTVQISSVVSNVICTCNLHLGWTLLEVINLQCHVIRRAQWRPAIKCNLGKGMGLSFPFFPLLMIGVISIITTVMSVMYRVCVSLHICPCALMY